MLIPWSLHYTCGSWGTGVFMTNETGRFPSYDMNLTMGDSDFSQRSSMLRFNPCSGNSLIGSRCFLTGLLPFVSNCQVTEFLEISELGLYQACSTATWPFTTSISRLGISTA